jgi:hypothetical protein
VAPAALILVLLVSCSTSTADAEIMAYSDLAGRASQGDVAAVVQEGDELSVTLRGEADPVTVVVGEQLNVWQELCAAAGTPEAGVCTIRYEFRDPSGAGSLVGLLISSLLPVLLIGGFVYFMARQAQARRP